ncbi:hypothetical protein [Deinococcus sp. PESE-13]
MSRQRAAGTSGVIVFGTEGMSVQARDGATINELFSIAKMTLERWPAAL